MKYLVIDSLARSGTTLLSSIIRTQDRCVSFDGTVMESLACASDNWSWPMGFATQPLIPSDEKQQISIFQWKKQFKTRIHKTFPRLAMGMSINEWNELIDEIHDFEDLEKFYDKLGKKFDASLVAFRWNQHLFYANKWLAKSDEHYWITTIRDPRDRAVSNYRTHGWDFHKNLNSTESYFQKYERLKDHPRLIIIYYEDLINDPMNAIEQLFRSIDFDVSNLIFDNFVGSDASPYRNQGWRSKDKLGNHRIGSPYTGFYNTSIGQYKKELPKPIKAKFNQLIERHPLLNRYLEEGV